MADRRGIMALFLVLGLPLSVESTVSAQTLSSATQTPVTVAVTKVTRGPIRAWISAEGTALAVRREILHFDRAGKVVEIGRDSEGLPLREGSSVQGPANGKPGQLIGQLDERDLREQVAAQVAQAEAARQRVEGARSAISEARSALAHAEQQLARARDLVAKGIAPRKQLDEAENDQRQAKARVQRAETDMAASQAEANAAQSQIAQARIRTEQSTLRAPFDGIIGFMNLAVGDYVSPLPPGLQDMGQLMRMAAAVVIDPTAYEVVVEIPSFQGMSLRRGMQAQIAWGGMNFFDVADKTAAAGGKTPSLPIANAEVYAVAPTIAPDSRAVRVRLRTIDGAGYLLDGLYVSVRILADERHDVIRVPVEAPRYDAGLGYVFVVDGKAGTAHRRSIKYGLTDGGMIQVRDGLEPGETVVVAGQDRLSDGALVHIATADGGS
ncbi:MAG: efflux RND transporter periplasmic adaptor subunit [Rhodospirillales bacterium]|jgi:RND family efflux transporter MFP subunit|nr:efflux RND transporter periplasmic adaptor subunit [Rhodospirillales bacterium]